MAQARGNRQRGRQPQGQQAQNRQELSMQNALATLKSMFETVDDNVIRMVLVEGCSGNMEQAVEALLRITEASSNESGGNGNSNNNNAPPAFGLPQPNEDAIRAAKPRRNNNNRGQINKKQNKQAMNQQLAQRAQNHRQRQQQNQQNQHKQQQQQQRRVIAQEARVVNLPDDFLRPPSYYLSRYPKERRQEVPQNNRKNPDPNYDRKTEREKQIIEDEIFAKAIFEDALFTQDLMNHPEWINDNSINGSDDFNPNTATWRVRSQSNITNGSNSNKKSPFGKNPFRNKRAQSSTNVHGSNDDIDPSNPQARKAKFKQNFEMLGDAAKSKMMNLASKLQRNKDDKRKGAKPANSLSAAPTYSNVLKSIDDETLIDDADDALEIDMASEQNRGTYRPPKPAQAL